MRTQCINITLFLLSLISLCKCSNDNLDVTDYTFYFKSYHHEFQLNNINDNNTNLLIKNEDIIIEFINNEFIINKEKTLNFSNDYQFNEINMIATTSPNHNKRKLLWNKWDHTTSNHQKMGRFIGDPTKVRTFDDARSLCREYYGDIASIRSKEDNKKILNLCKKLSGGTKSDKSCWIGLTQPYYEWENGQYVDWSNWEKDKPENQMQ